MAEIMAATEEALAAARHRHRPAEGRRALRRRDRANATGSTRRNSRLAGEVAALREALDRRTSAIRRLAELDRIEDRQDRRQAIETAQAAFDAAKAQGEVLKTAEAELTLARERRDAADRDLKAFRTALDKAKELRERLQEAEQRRGEAVGKRREIVDGDREGPGGRRDRGNRGAGDTRPARPPGCGVEGARGIGAPYRTETKTGRGGDRPAGRSKKAKRSSRSWRSQTSAVDELQALDVEIAKLRAVEEAARPSVAIAYETDAPARVTMDGTPLMGGDERGYDGQAQLSVPGIGTITLRSNRPARNDKQPRTGRSEAARAAGVDGCRRSRRGTGAADTCRSRWTPNGESCVAGCLCSHRRACPSCGKRSRMREARERRGARAEGRPRTDSDRAYAGRGAEKRQTARLPGARRSACGTSDRRGFRRRRDGAGLVARRAGAGRGDPRSGTTNAASARNPCPTASMNATATLDRGRDACGQELRAAAVDLESAEAALTRARSVDEAAEKEINTLRQSIAGLNGRISGPIGRRGRGEMARDGRGAFGRERPRRCFREGGRGVCSGSSRRLKPLAPTPANSTSRLS